MDGIRIGKGSVEAYVDMERGMNVTSLKYKGIDVIELDEERKGRGATYACPVLFPTPNRTAGGSFVFEGIRVNASVHGYARNSRFNLLERAEDYVAGECSFAGLSSPYDISMKIRIAAHESSLSWIFTVENKGSLLFPFSLALHPFFRKDVFRTLTANTAYQMEATEEKIPTGRLFRTCHDNGYCDRDISTINADTVYLTESGCMAELRGDGFSMVIRGSDEFRHLVVYGYPESSFICVEPQTGSTDFVNLHERGFENAAALISLKKGERRTLYADFCFR